MKNSTAGYLSESYVVQLYLAALYQRNHRLEWHWQIWGFVSGHASHKHREPPECEKIADVFAASKMQEENLGLETENEGTKEGKWDTDQISTG